MIKKYEVKKYQSTFEITNSKSEKKTTKCWSRIKFIPDIFIEMID